MKALALENGAVGDLITLRNVESQKYSTAMSPMIPKSKSSSRFLTVSCFALLAAIPAKAGSLWREEVTDERGMFADKRAKRVGDILTLVVQETVSVTNTAKTTTNKTSSTTAGNIADTVIKTFVGKLPDKLKGLKDANISTQGRTATRAAATSRTARRLRHAPRWW